LINFNLGGSQPNDDDSDDVDHTDIDQIFGFDNLEIEKWGSTRTKRLEQRKLLEGSR
jgi:hypothetical protein